MKLSESLDITESRDAELRQLLVDSMNRDENSDSKVTFTPTRGGMMNLWEKLLSHTKSSIEMYYLGYITGHVCFRSSYPLVHKALAPLVKPLIVRNIQKVMNNEDIGANGDQILACKEEDSEFEGFIRAFGAGFMSEFMTEHPEEAIEFVANVKYEELRINKLETMLEKLGKMFEQKEKEL